MLAIKDYPGQLFGHFGKLTYFYKLFSGRASEAGCDANATPMAKMLAFSKMDHNH